jgi:hypothetical protein
MLGHGHVQPVQPGGDQVAGYAAGRQRGVGASTAPAGMSMRSVALIHSAQLYS